MRQIDSKQVIRLDHLHPAKNAYTITVLVPMTVQRLSLIFVFSFDLKNCSEVAACSLLVSKPKESVILESAGR